MKIDRRTFVAGLGGSIASLSVPGVTSCAKNDRDPGAQHRAGSLGTVDDNTIVDVCIIGSGFAGSVLGEALVRRGVRTVILESGPDLSARPIDPRFHQLDHYRSSGPINYPVATTRLRAVGGTSWLWGGMCPRLQPIDFDRNSYTPPGASWPISYSDIQPYYGQAERSLRVRGGKVTKYHPPRDSDYPIPPDRDVSPLASYLLDAGIVVSDIPFSTGKGHHAWFSHDYFGPFVRMTDRHIPTFQSSPFGSLIFDATVTRLVVDEMGSIAGVEIKDLNRNTKTLRARVYVIACGGLETPRLLLLSRSAAFPNGIGNNYDLAGRYFTEHRTYYFRGQIQAGWRTFSLLMTTGQSYQFYREFKDLGLGGIALDFFLDGTIDPHEIKGGNFRSIIRRVVTQQLEIQMDTEMKPSPDNRVVLDPTSKDLFGNPGAKLILGESVEDGKTVDRGTTIVRKIFADLGIGQIEALPGNGWGHHHMGTCRMGDNPRTSVVDPNLRVHGTKNLFVAGSSVFVTSGTANPTLTLTALALRLSDHLRSQLQNGAFPAPRETRREGL